MGSGTLASWIQSNLDKDASTKAASEQIKPSVSSTSQNKKSVGFFSSIASVFGSSKNKNAEKEKEEFERRERDIDRNLSCEEMLSDDLSGELNLSSDEEGTMVRQNKKQKKMSKRKRRVGAAIRKQAYV